MLVRMKTRIGGYRNGEAWPAPGETIDVPAHEAHGLISNGYASRVAGDSEPIEGQVLDNETVAELEVTNADTPTDPDDDEEQPDGTDWSFEDPAGDGDDEAAARRVEAAAEHSGPQAAAHPVAPAAGAATKPTAKATKSKRPR